MRDAAATWVTLVHNSSGSCSTKPARGCRKLTGAVDAKTGRQRALQIDKAMACIDYAQGAVVPVAPVVETPTPAMHERLFDGAPFVVTRVSGKAPFTVGDKGAPRVLVSLAGDGQLVHEGANYSFGKGDVLLMPAVVGACVCPAPGGMTLLEVSLPEAG